MAGDGRPGPRPAVAPLTVLPSDATPAVVGLLIERRARELSEEVPVVPPIPPPTVVAPPGELLPYDAPPVVDTPDVEVLALPDVVLLAEELLAVELLPVELLPDELLSVGLLLGEAV